tara:strand:- start:883 stop:1023 length:141 start_codon:yes stop_codon:yes gene_type:complete
MSKFWLILFLLTLGGVLGGAVFLMNWDIPAPTQRVETIIDNDRFPR